MISPHRVFLGWDVPVLGRLARWIMEQIGPDLSDVLAVVSGRRAGRLLLARLVEEAEASKGGRGFVPPRVVTPGAVPEHFYRPPLGLATDTDRLLAWCSLLDTAAASALHGGAESEAGVARRLPLARELCRVQDELGREGLSLADVQEHLHVIESTPEQNRWQTLGALEGRWRRLLQEKGRIDSVSARVAALEGRALSEARWRVLLCCLPVVAGLERRFLEKGACAVTALVAAPREEATLFDDWGAVEPQAWHDRRLELCPQELEFVDRPRDQVVAAAAAVGAESPGGRVTLGLAETRLATAAEAELRRRGIGFHSALGPELRLTAPWLLLEGLSEYVETRSFAGLALLLRHPDLETALAPSLREEARRCREEGTEGRVAGCLESGDWLSLLDIYTSETLQAVVGEAWPGDPAAARVVAAMDAAVLRALGLGGPEELAHRRKLAEWAARIRRLMLRLYGERRFDTGPEEGLPLRRLGEILAELETSGQEGPSVAISEAIALLLARIDGERSVVDRGGEVEMVGWLELLVDDAPALVVAGMNEGAVPAPAAEEASLLGLPLRRALGLAQDSDRYARDLFLLEHLTRSRRLRLVAGRWGERGEPLAPSRLLLACADDELTSRLLEFYRREEGEGPGEIAPTEGGLSAVRPAPDTSVPRSLPVTAFRDYLACPYRFWLVHCCGLAPMRDLPREMSPAFFGGLLHRVLGAFVRRGPALTTDADEAFRFLDELLEQISVETCGAAPRVAVRVQLEQARRRLRSFSRWHVGQIREGWEPLPAWAEATLGGELEVDGAAIRLTGRIDRLDRHPERGVRLVDYKSSEVSRSPEDSHREARRGARRWIDLQLPLYDFMLRQNGVEGAIELSFVHLDPHLRSDPLAPAQWSSRELAEAVDVAKGVVRDIRAGRFWPPGPPPRYDDGLAGLVGDRFRDRQGYLQRRAL